MRQARAECADERQELADRLEQLVEAERRARADTRELVARERVRRRQACKDRRREAKAKGQAVVDATRQQLKAVPRWRELEVERIRRRRAERSHEIEKKRGKRRGRRGIEAIQEHADRTERIIEGWRPDLVRLWKKHGRTFGARGGTPEQRAERFIETYGSETEAGAESWAELDVEAERKVEAEWKRYLESGGKNPSRCPRGTRVQSLVFPRSWSSKAAASWASSHGFRSSGIDTTQTQHRIRQAAPSAFTRGSFRTINLGRGVRATIGCPKE